MKKYLIGLILFCAIAFATQWLFIRYVPNLVFRIATKRTGNNFNHWINAPKTDAGLRRVVMPNPDFVYSALFYDVKENDIKISGVLPDSVYGSVSFYDDRCQPYYVYNSIGTNRTGPFSFKLSKKGIEGANLLRAKTERGVIICRFLLTTDSSYGRMLKYQEELNCERM